MSCGGATSRVARTGMIFFSMKKNEQLQSHFGFLF
jgi:hypothetical protein